MGLFSDVTLDKQLGTNSKGKNWIPLFSSTAYSQDGRQIMNRWVGMEGFLEEVVPGLEVEIRQPGGARHDCEKEQELPPQDRREMSLHLLFRVNKEEGVTLSGNRRGTTRVPKKSLAC